MFVLAEKLHIYYYANQICPFSTYLSYTSLLVYTGWCYQLLKINCIGNPDTLPTVDACCAQEPYGSYWDIAGEECYDWLVTHMHGHL